MFNSQKINNDPFPYVSESGTRHANPGWLNSGYFSNRRERPEYDNNPNPILISFREQSDWGNINQTGKYEECAEWLWWLGDPTHSVYKFQRLEHIDHAKRVLEKLVNVYG